MGTPDGSAVAAKPRKPFLRRGEGVDKRMNAYKLRGKVQPKPSSARANGPSRGSTPRNHNGGGRTTEMQKHYEPTFTVMAPAGGGAVKNSPPRHSQQPKPQDHRPEHQQDTGTSSRSSPSAQEHNNDSGVSGTFADWAGKGRLNDRELHGPPNPSDFSMELSCDSTLVSMQQACAATAGYAAPANDNGAEAKTAGELTWAERLNMMVSGVQNFGFDQEEVEEDERPASNLDALPVRADISTIDGSWGLEDRRYSLRPMSAHDKEAEEALELEEFEALERKVRRELGEASIDCGKPAEALAVSFQPGSVQEQRASVWDQYMQEEEVAHVEGLHQRAEAFGYSQAWEADSFQGRPGGAGGAQEDEASWESSSSQRPSVLLERNPIGADDWDAMPSFAPQHEAAASSRPSTAAPQWGNRPDGPPGDSFVKSSAFEDEDTWEEDYTDDPVDTRAAGQFRDNVQTSQGRKSFSRAASDGEGGPPPASALMQGLFHKGREEESKTAREAQARAKAERLQAEKIGALEDEIKKFQAERSECSRLKNELQVAASKLESEKNAFERQKAAELAGIQEQKEEAARIFKREKSVLEKQRRALLKMPDKKERAEIETLQAALEKEKRDGRAREARHKLTVERLRRQMVEQQQRNTELKEEIQWHEKQRLEEPQPATDQPKKAKGAKAGHKVAAPRVNSKENTHPNCYDDFEATLSISHTHEQLPEGDSGFVKGVDMKGQPGMVIRESQPVTGNQAKHESSFSFLSVDGHEEDADLADVSEKDEDVEQESYSSMYYAQRSGMYRTSGAEHLQSSQDYSYTADLTEDRETWPPEESHGHRFQGAAHLSQSQEHGESVWGMYRAAPAQDLREDRTMPNDPTSTTTRLQSPQGVQYDLKAFEPIRFEIARPQQRTSDSAEGIRRSARAEISALPSVPDNLHQHHNGEGAGTFPVGPHGKQGPVRGTVSMMPSDEAAMFGPDRGTAASARPLAARVQGPVRPPAFPDQQAASQGFGYAPQHRPESHPQQSGWQQQQQQRFQHAPAQKAEDVPGPAPVTPQIDGLMADINRMSQVWQKGMASVLGQQADAHPNDSHIQPKLRLNVSQSQAQTQAGGVGREQHSPRYDQQGQWQTQQAGSAATATVYTSRPSSAGTAKSLDITTKSRMHEARHPDGKVEQLYPNGKRTVRFANGTFKEQHPDGTSVISFTNMDIKRTYADGKVEYYYSEVDTWHTTYSSGVEVFYFANGQTEAHQPNGIKQIVFPDGMIRQVLPTGMEEDLHPSLLLPALREVPPVMPPMSVRA